MQTANLERVLDIEAIRHLLTSYVFHGDRGELEELVALFAPDGILEMGKVHCEGQAQLLDWLRSARPYGDGETRPKASVVRHHLTTMHIDLHAAMEASALTYFQTLTDVGLDHYGYYKDALVRIDGAWKFARRMVRIQWRAADSFILPD